jgi:hypothetical protein
LLKFPSKVQSTRKRYQLILILKLQMEAEKKQRESSQQ